jgi:hypothetical protein
MLQENYYFWQSIKNGPSLDVTIRIEGHNSENFAPEFKCQFTLIFTYQKEEEHASNVFLNLHFQQPGAYNMK